MHKSKLVAAHVLFGLWAMTSLSLAQITPDKQQTVSPKYTRPGDTRKFTIEHTAKISEIPSGTKKLRVWMPVPPDSTVQVIRELGFSERPRITSEPKYGNQIAYWEFKEPPPTVELTMKFRCERKETVMTL